MSNHFGSRHDQHRQDDHGNGGGTTVDIFRRLGFHQQTTQFVATFSQPMDAARAQDLNNYLLISAGRDHVLGTADDQAIPLRSAVYDPATPTPSRSCPSSACSPCTSGTPS